MTAAGAPAVELAVAAVGAAPERTTASRPTTAAAKPAEARGRAPAHPADTRKCFGCGEPGHLRRNCTAQVYAVAGEPAGVEAPKDPAHPFAGGGGNDEKHYISLQQRQLIYATMKFLRHLPVTVK